MMALLNRFSKLNDRGETGIFTFIVTKSVTRDFHRDATTKDFCFGYHRWAISFQRPTEKVLGVHLLLRNASPNTACVVDFTLTLLNREHFSQNQVYSKRQAKFTITNPMQGVSRWIQMSKLIERRFSNETGEFLFELSLSNMSTIFECDIQLNPTTLNQYKQMLKASGPAFGAKSIQGGQQQQANNSSGKVAPARGSIPEHQLINLETNCFTFGAFDWSLTIVPLVMSSGSPSSNKSHQQTASSSAASTTSNALHSLSNQPAATNQSPASSTHGLQSAPAPATIGSTSTSTSTSNNNSSTSSGYNNPEPVCRVYLNRLTGFDTLCRVKYRVILGHHQQGVGAQSVESVDSKVLDQISDNDGRIRGYQFRNTNILKLLSVRSSRAQQQQQEQQQSQLGPSAISPPTSNGSGRHYHQHHHHSNLRHHHSSPSSAMMGAASAGPSSGHHHHNHHHQNHYNQQSASVDLRVHIEMFCANSVSEAKVPLNRKMNESQGANCSDRNKQAWCVESDNENGDLIRLKLFFLDLQSVPRNHIRYISWIAYLVRRDTKSGLMRDSIPVKSAPHSNYYLQDGIDMGIIMETDVKVRELQAAPQSYLEGNMLTVHIEWVDSLLLFSHLYNNYDALATIQRHQISRELDALQQEFEYLERKHEETCKMLNRYMDLADQDNGNNSKDSFREDEVSVDQAKNTVQEETNINGTNTNDFGNNNLNEMPPSVVGSLDNYEQVVENRFHHQAMVEKFIDSSSSSLGYSRHHLRERSLSQPRESLGHLDAGSQDIQQLIPMSRTGRSQDPVMVPAPLVGGNRMIQFANDGYQSQIGTLACDQRHPKSQVLSTNLSSQMSDSCLATSNSSPSSCDPRLNLMGCDTTGTLVLGSATSGYQSKPSSPIMSQEERLKLSSSTPPFASCGNNTGPSNYSSTTHSRYTRMATTDVQFINNSSRAMFASGTYQQQQYRQQPFDATILGGVSDNDDAYQPGTVLLGSASGSNMQARRRLPKPPPPWLT